MKKPSVVLTIAAALMLLLGNSSGAGSSPTGSLPYQLASAHPAVAAAGGKGVLTIPAAAFTLTGEGADYENHARYLIHHSGVYNTYMASVELPQGATVTRMTMHFYNTTALYGVETELQRTDLRGGFDEMASVFSYSSGGYGSVSTDAIAYATVDNANYAYYAEWVIDGSIDEVRGCAVTIEYDYPAATPGTDYLSFSAAAFTPFEDGYAYDKWGRSLRHRHSPGGGMADGWYMAPVHLPDGATVIKIKFYWYDQTTTVEGHGLAKLQRTRLGQGNWEDMASANTWFMPGGYWDSESTFVVGATIDNSQYAYWVIWSLPAITLPDPDVNVEGLGMIIEYSRPSAGSGVGRISIPAAAFGVPFEDGYDFQDHGRYLFHVHSPGGGSANGLYLAPLLLPQGATVTKMTFHWYDNDAAVDGWAKLHRTQLGTDNWADVISLNTHTDLPVVFSCTSTTASVVIDNTRYLYALVWDLPVSIGAIHPGDGDVAGVAVTIGYAFRVSLPMILRNY